MRILVTGGKGFIGAWVIRRLWRAGLDVRVFDVADVRELLEAVAGRPSNRLEWVVGDIVDPDQVMRATKGCDGVIHLAGILTPACQANPLLGAKVNLLGTLNVFDAALAHGARRVVYTSSAGVFGPDDGNVPLPTTHYGAFKLACEGSARAYWADHGIGSVGFRPFIVYGPGRETGLTSGPSLACKAAAQGRAYTIPYSGGAGLVFVDDIAAAYEQALLREPDGAHVFNLTGVQATNDDVIAAIRRVVPDAQIDAGGPPIPIAADVAPDNVAAILPDLPTTSLQDGVAATIDFWRRGGRAI